MGDHLDSLFDFGEVESASTEKEAVQNTSVHQRERSVQPSSDDTEVYHSDLPEEREKDDRIRLVTPRAGFITGGAGTGKTTLVRERIAGGESGILCATTGIAALNLGAGVTTINSLLGYFDTRSLMEKSEEGGLDRALARIPAKNLYLDEASMLQGLHLDLLWGGLLRVNQLREVQDRGGLGLMLTGDFCQLPPVPDRELDNTPIPCTYAFEAQCWEYFAQNTTKLEKVWRQDNPLFLQALNHARRGEGEECAAILATMDEVTFSEQTDIEWDGTTIYATNKEVDRMNQVRLAQLLNRGVKPIKVHSDKWGAQRNEWKLIPPEDTFGVGAYVMIYANDTQGGVGVGGGRKMRYANGSCGWVREFREDVGLDGEKHGQFLIELRPLPGQPGPGEEVTITQITRRVTTKETPDGFHKPVGEGFGDWKGDNPGKSKWDYIQEMQEKTRFMRGKNKWEPYWDYVDKKWCIGEVTHFPLRLAYASTCHKSQGLTLEKVQIDLVHRFFASPSMGYVALSRVRQPEGLRIVGRPQLLANRVNVSRKVVRWL